MPKSPSGNQRTIGNPPEITRPEVADVLIEATQHEAAPAEAFFWLGEALAGRDVPRATDAFRRYLALESEGYFARRAKRALGPLF